MNTVKVRNLELGAGLPKICVPITGRNREEVLEQAAAIRKLPADLAEWRFDYFYNASKLSLLTVLTFLAELRKALGDLPLLFTFRTLGEGGEKSITHQTYEELNKTVLSSGMADLIDVELSMGEDLVERLLAAAREKGVKVIVSSHDFEKTPPKDEIVHRLKTMEALGADLAKVAVMPQSEEDVEVLMDATREYAEEASIPAVTMSMGALGEGTRFECEAFGSAVTFGSAGRASAPGQPEVAELKKALEQAHGQ